MNQNVKNIKSIIFSSFKSSSSYSYCFYCEENPGGYMKVWTVRWKFIKDYIESPRIPSKENLGIFILSSLT